ncbi:MAG: YegS/Rv2252/BmrU family lipid kinase [Candidatus Latescibacteria bacterium]|nr:YegS/Rv2252/BmrU family lipid kinase [Candidatus Latescibacterota bacterium]NIM66522.1 YegS/Rv2252/BmrU family lipid kinase [Candidatus Latescibacterota bacterium]NIO03002.1 YegS/Rv2252/BmrU family lipid kinase [Candidatus Latescibacterota bacterium]NIO30137.1 YegS/Rv2252/BmrU family lipid kinase [Candidatus Latescibacterota bacterium]NIO57756.1 YegS/Rv2252/BmrU family lipid kinase [Candidatus Latescibacterota bacterium]
MNAAIIANPFAGRGRTKRIVEQFLPRAKALGLSTTFEWTRGPGDGIDLAKRLSGSHDVLCVIGGDGTIHEAVNGLMPDPIPVVFVPTGSGNDFAKLLPCPTTPEELLQTLEMGLGYHFDVVETGFRYCINSIGLGFEALVTQHSRSIHRLSGVPLYLLAVFKSLASFLNPTLRMAIDDEEMQTGEKLLVSIGNGVSAGGGFYLTPNACPDDGHVDLCIVSPMGRLRILRLLPLALKGTHTNKRGVEMRRVTSLTIDSHTPYHLHVDGEYLGEKPWRLRIFVRERVLPILCLRRGPTRAKHSIVKIL